ncbi:MAG: zinc ribbon domain-containing protein [Anaerolineales bacterium]|nr:zinc ribbon domain-containing protein [Anaerolineales bacterium]
MTWSKSGWQCPKCEAQNPEKISFCYYCGTPLIKSSDNRLLTVYIKLSPHVNG